MAQSNDISVPSGFGGLLRFKEEYESVIKLKPIHVVGFIILIIAFVIILNVFFPLTPQV
ncbi:MAG: preprotein translocase subunit Sec61beta [Nanoarchaeota archaeon]